MTIYVPNVGEKEMLKDFLLSQAIVLGLYKNVVVPDGSTIMATLTEMTTGGGEGYAQIPLINVLNEVAPATGQWYISLDVNGKASAQYGLTATPQAWTFNAFDVADVETVYGIFGYTWVLPFDLGAKEIKVGRTIKGATSGATGIVTAVDVQSGTWAGGTAAGYLKIMTKTGTFQDDENILISGEPSVLAGAPTAAGLGYAAGDLFKITTGGTGAVGVVVAVGGGGAVTTVELVTAPEIVSGTGYTTGAGKVTAKITGAGNDALTVNITTLASVAYAVTNTGATADASKQLLFVEAFSAGTLINTVGQQVTYLPVITFSTAP